MLEFIVEDTTPHKIRFEVNKLLNLGRTGRDPGQIQKHIDELKKAGIAAVSTEIPLFFPKLPDRITTDDSIQVLPQSKTCGEVEYVILIARKNIYVTVGSDHSDRELEKHSISASKQMCENIVAPKVWLYENVREHWDDIVMRSWVHSKGQRKLYQQGCMSDLLRPEKVIEKVKLHVKGDLEGIIIFAGTLPIIAGEFCFHSLFEMELVDEHTSKEIRWAYSTNPMTWFEK